MEEYVAKATGSLSNTIRARNNEYHGFYRGTVVNNEDPKDRGRCKIFVRGVYNEEFKDEKGKLLPWAEPCQPLFCGGMGDDGANGTFQCPDMHSTVWCFFENSDILKPVFFGQTTDANGKFSTKHCKMKWEKMYVDLYRGTNDRFTSSIIDSLSSSETNNNNNVEDTSYVMTLSANTDTISIARRKNAYRFAGKSIHDIAKSEDFTRYAYRDIIDTAETNDFIRYAYRDIIDTAETNDFIRFAGNDIGDYAGGSMTLSAETSSITIVAPNSDITINAAKSVLVTAGNSVTITAPSIVLSGDTKIDGTCVITKNVTMDANVSVGGDSTVAGDATIGGISFKSHVHAISFAPGISGPPE